MASSRDACFATRLRGLGLGRFSRIERGYQRVELGDSRPFAVQSSDGVGNRRVPATRSPPGYRDARSACAPTSVELAEKPASWVSSWRLSSASRCCAAIELDAGHAFVPRATFELGRGNSQTLLRLLQRRRRGPTAGRADPPTGRPEAVAVVGDDDGLRIGDGEVDRFRPCRNTNGGADDRVEQFGYTGLLRCARAAVQRRPARPAQRRRSGRGAERDHCAMHVRTAQASRGPGDRRAATQRPLPPTPRRALLRPQPPIPNRSR